MASLIMQDLIETKEMLEKVKHGLIDSYYNRATQKMLSDITNTHDLPAFHESIKKNKDALLAFGK